MRNAELIQKEVLDDCRDSVYHNSSILDIYWKNENYLRNKLKSHPLSEDSMEFLANNIQRIEEIHETVYEFHKCDNKI